MSKKIKIILSSLLVLAVLVSSAILITRYLNSDGGKNGLCCDRDHEHNFYKNAIPAKSHSEALARSQNGQLSGATEVPDQAPSISSHRPSVDGVLIRNSQTNFPDPNTYIVVDCCGYEVFRVYRGGGYITLEEVAAYIYAFAELPANYVSGKNADPGSSIWGEYLRLNHSKFSGNTSKYPYEPELPNISGCGGDLTYYELDIGTTGTDCDPGYSVRTYNDGKRITRGAARIVYTRFDADGDLIIEQDEKFLFYAYNHYNDFQEYLNYYGGWGNIFGNVTGGGKLSSKYDYAPTPYIKTVLAPINLTVAEAIIPDVVLFLPPTRRFV